MQPVTCCPSFMRVTSPFMCRAVMADLLSVAVRLMLVLAPMVRL